MNQITIVYWHDIPARVMVSLGGEGFAGTKVMLPIGAAATPNLAADACEVEADKAMAQIVISITQNHKPARVHSLTFWW